MSYILIFPTLIKLRYSHPEVPRPYKVPFGMVGVWLRRDLTTCWALLATVVGLFPGSATAACSTTTRPPRASRAGTFELVVFIPIIITLAHRRRVLRGRAQDARRK